MRVGGGSQLINLLLLGFLRASPKGKLVILLIVGIAFFLFRGQLTSLLGVSSASSPQVQTTDASSADDEMEQYLRTMMGDNEQVWGALLPRYGVEYSPCQMVIYTGRTMTKGGLADARMGPFYAPAERTIYIDPTFFRELKERFGATGDFAEAYVVAHEYAHHIQNILGRLDQLHSARARLSKTEFNKGSVRVELHADFLSGVFAHHAEGIFRDFLDAGDIEEAMRAAAAIGDDRIQRDFGPGYVNPDSFTHGTSEQRARWFRKGFESGDLGLGEQLYELDYGAL